MAKVGDKKGHLNNGALTNRPELGNGTFDRSFPLLLRTTGLCEGGARSPACKRATLGFADVGLVGLELEGVFVEMGRDEGGLRF